MPHSNQKLLSLDPIHHGLTFDADWVAGDPRELTYELTQFRRVAGASRLACTQQTHCGMHTSIFSHTQMTTRAGSLVYVRVESGCKRAEGHKRTLPIISSSFWMTVGVKGLIPKFLWLNGREVDSNDHGVAGNLSLTARNSEPNAILSDL